MAGIKLKNIHKTYQVDGRAFPVLNGIDLEIPAGKITVILGQSGCGKTTLLRLTGGLESADDGEILWDGDHKTAFVFQEPRLDSRTFPVLNGVDLEIPEGKITVILGQSGCGKTTLLRLTGGLESADSGEVLWDGAHKTAFVFQEPRLMPWLNVWNNIIYEVGPLRLADFHQ